MTDDEEQQQQQLHCVCFCMISVLLEEDDEVLFDDDESVIVGMNYQHISDSDSQVTHLCHLSADDHPANLRGNGIIL